MHRNYVQKEFTVYFEEFNEMSLVQFQHVRSALCLVQ